MTVAKAAEAAEVRLQIIKIELQNALSNWQRWAELS
jgi:hypothetical protein